MNERSKGLFPLFLGLGILSVCGIFFGVVTWLSQPYVPANPQLTADAPLSGSIQALKDIPTGNFTYGGSAVMVPIRQVVEPLVAQATPQFKLLYVNPIDNSPSSARGMEMLLSGEVAFSEISRPIKPEEYTAAEQQGFELQQTPVAIDGIAVVAHPNLDIEGLTLDQLRDIFLGNIVNWQDVGGPNIAIRPFSKRPSESGTASFFVERILQGGSLGNQVEIASETTPVLRKIAETPGGIYYTSAPLAVPQCTVKTLPLSTAPDRPFVAPYQRPQVEADQCPQQRNQINKDALRNGTYPLTRRLFVVAKRGSSPDAVAGQAYTDILLSAEGQTLVEEAGFVNIR